MRWKWIFGVAVALTVALIVTIYVILSSYDFNSLKPKIARAVKDATGRELILGGDIELEIGLTPALVAEDVRFQNAPWAFRPEMAKIRRFEVQVALLPLIGGTIDVKRLILVEPDILVATNKSGKSNLEFKTVKKAKPAEPKEKTPAEAEMTLPALTFNEVRIEKGRLTYKDERSGRTYVVRLDSLTAMASDKKSPVELELKGAYNRKPFEVAGTFGPLIALTDPGKALSLKLTAKAGDATVAVDGAIRDAINAKGLALTINAKCRSIAGIAGPTDAGPFKVTAKLTDDRAKTYKISDLKITIGESNLVGSVKVSLADKRPRLVAMLSSRKLDLRPVLSKDEGVGQSSESAAKQGKIFSDDPLPLDVLKQADVNVKIRAGQILLPLLALNDLKVNMVLEDGHLTVRPLKFVIGGGALDGRFNLRPQGKSANLALVLKTDQLDLGRMLKDLEVNGIIEGKMDIEIDLNGSGGSMAALMAGLNGKAIMVMGDGRIGNKYIDLLGTDLSSGIFQLFNPSKHETNLTQLNCFVIGFNIKDGLAESTALVFDTNIMTVVGDGKLNLKTEELALSLNPSPKKGIGIKGVGKLSLSLTELTKSFKLGGTLANPSLAIDRTRTVITLGKAVGGAVLFGPAGIATALATGSSGDEENPCLAAIEAAKKGVKVSGGEEEEKKGVVESVGNGLKKLFGR